MNITIVAGARPNFIKIAPIIKAISAAQKKGNDIRFRLVHTGQHYDKRMSSDFFQQLGIPDADVNLKCGSGSQAEQTASIMIGFEKELLNNRPNLVLVVGDVTSTMACTITAKKLCIDVAHVEAGIRSGDINMPEEVNRIVTDAICDHFFTTSEFANAQLRKIGVEENRIHFVGNTMIDTLYQNIDKLIKPDLWTKYNLTEHQYYLTTLHRPSNVDNASNLDNLLEIIIRGTKDWPIIFPLHPRTRKNLSEQFLQNSKLIIMEPMAYLEFLFLIKYSKAIITDSGGITEEATVLQVPCITLRNSTERPETVDLGSNELAGTDPQKLLDLLEIVEMGTWKKSSIPPLWDGQTSVRIVDKLLQIYLA